MTEAQDKEQKAQAEALDKVRELAGSKETGVPDAAPGSYIFNMISDKRDPAFKKIDWLKVGFLGLATLMGGVFGAGMGNGSWLAMGIGAAVGVGAMAFGVGWLSDTLRGDTKGHTKHVPPPVFTYASYKEVNEKVIKIEKLVLPDIAPLKLKGETLDIPAYDAAENPDLANNKSISEVHAAVATLSRRAARAKPYVDADTNEATANINAQLRNMLSLAEADVKSKENMLRYAADELRAKLTAPMKKTDAYLEKLGVDHENRDALAFDMEGLKRVPGLKGKFADAGEKYKDLDTYGKEIFRYYLTGRTPPIKGKMDGTEAGLAYESARDGKASMTPLTEEEEAALAKVWNTLSLGNKRVLIQNFAPMAVWNTHSQQVDYQEFYPDRAYNWGTTTTPFITTPIKAIGHDALDILPFVNTQMGKLYTAHRAGDWKQVTELLKERLAHAVDGTAPLDSAKQFKLRTLILGEEAHRHLGTLDTYMGILGNSPATDSSSPFAQQNRQLDTFEREYLPEYQQRHNMLKERMQGLGATKLFLAKQEALDQNRQDFILQDVRGEKPATITVNVTYKDNDGKQIEKIRINGAELSSDKLGAMPEGDSAKTQLLLKLIEQAEGHKTSKASAALRPAQKHAFSDLVNPESSVATYSGTAQVPPPAWLNTTPDLKDRGKV
jgi:hypothetical protein